MTKIIRAILFFISCGIIFTVVMYFLFSGVDKEEKIRCNNFVQQSKEFEGFWVSAHDKVVCSNLGIDIDAEIR